MYSLANFLLHSRLHAIAVTTLLTVLSQLLSPLAYMLSGAPLALVSLRQGGSAGIQVLLGSLLVLLLLTSLLKLTPVLPTSFAAIVWLPVVVCSVVLRTGQAQGLMLLAAGAVCLVFLLYIHSMREQLMYWWQQWFQELQAVAVDAQMAARLQEIYEVTSPLITTVFISCLFVNLVMTMLFARWWQALLFNPGGFRAEFYRLRLPRPLAYLTLVIVIMMVLQPQLTPLWLRDLMVILLLLYAVLGLSVAHRFVSTNNMHRGWLVAMYCLLLLPQMILLIACLGLAHTWRTKADSKGDDDRQ